MISDYHADALISDRAMVLGSKTIKLFSCSTQPGMQFELLITIKIAKVDGISGLNR